MDQCYIGHLIEMALTGKDISRNSPSTSSGDGDLAARFRHSLPVPLYSAYHGEDSENEVEEELREREYDYGFRASSEQATRSTRGGHRRILTESGTSY